MRGSILKRRNKDGTITYSIKYRTSDGTQVKRAIGSTRADAEKALTEALSQVDKGRLMKPSRETFASASERWLARKAPRLEMSTRQDYERHLRLRLLPAFGPMPLRRITRRHIDDYVRRLDGEGKLSRKTINDSLIPLRQILGMAAREGCIAVNPAVSVDRDFPVELPHERPTMSYLTRDQTRMYLESAPVDYLPLAEVLVGAGLRISEALALTWSDLDLDGGTISITKSFKVDGLGTPKGDRPRDVVVADYLLRLLIDRRPAGAPSTELLFRRPNGSPIRRQRVHRFWHRPTLEDAGLPRCVRLHDLRHTAATLWLASGQSIYFVQQQLGHRDIQTTIDLYGHPDRQAHREAAQQAARWWRDGVSEGVRVPREVPRDCGDIPGQDPAARPDAVYTTR